MAAVPAGLAHALQDRYRLERELGRGGMATVYLAYDLKLDRRVALKVLRPELAAALGPERFLREIRTTAQLAHPHILPLLDSGNAGGTLFYTMPLVAGESLRARLLREKQLPLDDALQITREVADALSYAHAHGVIHRDIKPENILLQEGHAVVADFGIARAVGAAGGERLTDTGIAIGTPAYMSPEQAVGSPDLDARSDLYSLGCVLYEILSGEPPYTGPTAQAILAKKLNEPLPRISVLRDSVSPGVEAALNTALARTPADRWPTVAAFSAALSSPESQSTSAPSVPPRARPAPRWAPLAAAAAAIALLVALAMLVSRPGHGHASERWVVRDRTQLTSTGNASSPAISPDGKQVAYVTKHCAAGACRAGIEILDLGSGATRLLVDSVETSERGLPIRWSWDRRFLLFTGRIGTRQGTYLASTVGDNPNPVQAHWGAGASFVPGRDSLVFSLPKRPDSIAYVAVAPLGADYRDSIQIGKVGIAGDVFIVPGGRWMIVETTQRGALLRHQYRAVDRLGRPRDSVEVPTGWWWEVSGPTAFWIQNWTRPFSIIRLPFDTATGHFSGPGDTVLLSSTGGFDASEDAGALVYADGTTAYGLWALDLPDAFKGQFASSRGLRSGTEPIKCQLSPDGSRLLLLETVARGGREGRDVVLLPFQGGPPLAHWLMDSLLDESSVHWMPDGLSFSYAARTSGGVQLVTVDVRSGLRHVAAAIADSGVLDFSPLSGGGWAWWSASDGQVRLLTGGALEPTTVPLLKDEIGSGVHVTEAPSHQAVASWAYSVDRETLFLDVTLLPRGPTTRWAAFSSPLGRRSGLWWLTDGSVIVWLQQAEQEAALYRVRGPGQVQQLGVIRRSLEDLSISQDGRHVAMVTRDFRGDIWLAHLKRTGGP